MLHGQTQIKFTEGYFLWIEIQSHIIAAHFVMKLGQEKNVDLLLHSRQTII